MQLNEIFSDKRLTRLFDSGEATCVVEMWVLQTKSSEVVSSRMVYGRILPSNFTNNTWNAQREDSFKRIDDSLEAQLKRITAFVESNRVRNLLTLLVEGRTLDEASQSAGIKLSEAAVRFAGVKLNDALALRPIMHLPTRDYFLLRTNRLSQASDASMDSAAITSLSKGEMFVVDGYARPELAKLVTDSEGDNTGRLALAEWLKRLFATHQDKHIVWFDPFMEDVGVTLINQYGFTNGSYVIFTNAQEAQLIPNWYEHILHRNSRGHNEDEPDTPVGTRVSRLVSACKAWNRQMKGVRLQVVGLPDETLHDRMIVVRDAKMEPVMGFQLSNSIQKANENFPLLITPIPLDALWQVCDYTDKMLQRVAERVPDEPREGIDAMVLFDSNDEPKVRETASHPELFSMRRAGDVLSWWTGYDSLAGLTGDALKSLLQELALLDEDKRFRTGRFDLVPEKFWLHGQDITDFNSWWDAMGTLLAHSPAGIYISELGTNPSVRNDVLSELLVEYLRPGRADAMQPLHSGPITDVMKEMQRSHEELLRSRRHRHQAYRERFTMLSWGDKYALRVLWFCAPVALVRWIEQQAAGPNDGKRRRQLLLSQAVSLISLGTEFGCSKVQLDALLSSSSHYIRWLGFVALETLLQGDHKLLPRIEAVGHLSQVQKACVLGWLLARSGRGATPLRVAMISELHQVLPQHVDKAALDALLESMRNPLGRIYEAQPWILADVIARLVESGRLSPDDVAQAWVDELFAYWEYSEKQGSLLFDVHSEGMFTEQIVALLLSCSAPKQKELLKRLTTEVDSIHRAVTQILAHQVDYSRTRKEYDKAMWIGCLVRSMLVNGGGPVTLVQLEGMRKICTKTTEIVERTNWAINVGPVERSLFQYWEAITNLLERQRYAACAPSGKSTGAPHADHCHDASR